MLSYNIVKLCIENKVKLTGLLFAYKILFSKISFSNLILIKPFKIGIQY